MHRRKLVLMVLQMAENPVVALPNISQAVSNRNCLLSARLVNSSWIVDCIP